MKKAMFLIRNPKTGDVEKIRAAYRGNVDAKVYERVGKRFLKLDAGGYFWPLDGMDAYGEAIEQIEKMQKRLERGEVVLDTASPVTYLVNVGARSLLHFHQRQVAPVRETHRAVERHTSGRGAVGEDSFDIDNYDGTQDAPDKAMCDACGDVCEESLPAGSALTAQQLVEQLPGLPTRRERRDQAQVLLREICSALIEDGVGGVCAKAGVEPMRIVKAFCAYILEDGNFPKAAKRAKIGINRFYAEWPRWIAIARTVGENIRQLRH